MTNDELKALCESNARAIAALASAASQERQQRSTNTDEIDTLLGAVSSNEVACRELREVVTVLAHVIGESNQRFDILRAEAIADRQRSDQLFAAQLKEIKALGEQSRSFLLALSDTNSRVENLEQAS